MAKKPVKKNGSSSTAYCLSCRESVTPKAAKTVTSENNMRMLKGKCPNCEGKVCKILGKA